MLNWLKDELNLKSKARLGIADAFPAYGILKVYFTSESTENPRAGEAVLADDNEPMANEDGSFVLEPDVIPMNGQYNVSRVHPDDVLWNEDAGPLEDSWEWMGQQITIPFADAKKNPLFSKVALRSIKGQQSKDEEEKLREERKKGDSIVSSDVKGSHEVETVENPVVEGEPEDLTYWEIWHLKTDKWSAYADGADQMLFHDQDQPVGVEKHPYSILRFTPLRDDSPYPIPPMSQGIKPQNELNLNRSQQMRHRKRFNRKYEVGKQAGLDGEGMSKLESGDDGTVLDVKMVGQIQPIKDAPLDQQNLIEKGYLERDINEMLGGTTDEARGVAGADSATQAGILEKRLDIKEGDGLSLVVDWIKGAIRKLDQLVATHLTKAQAVRVVGPGGDEWSIVGPEAYDKIDGEWTYEVATGSTVPQLPQVERASFIAFLQALAASPTLLLSPQTIKKLMEMHHIEDEKMINELVAIGKRMFGESGPIEPTKSGSQAGVGESRPVSAVGGQQGGFQSLDQAGAGNIEA